MPNKPNLETRFLKPENWQSAEFFNPETNHHIHFQHNIPRKDINGVILALPGLSEFGEKYYETAQFFIKQGYDFYVIDWAYQGKSTRFYDNPHKRYSDGYDTDINDLKYLIDHYIDSHPPLFLLGHSMGGHIGLRFLSEQPDYVQAASFSAPMLCIKDLKYTNWLVHFLNSLFKFFKKSYVPGGKDWRESARSKDGTDIFSSDPDRGSVHNIWCLHNPALQVGNATIQWILESLISSRTLKQNLHKIDIPALLAIAEKEELVDNQAIKNAAHKAHQLRTLFLKDSKHEILMETDDIRDLFLEETLKIFKQSG